MVEGYVDVLLLHKYGYYNTVGIMGTSFTDRQQKLLRTYTKNIMLWFDGDGAGERSMERHLPSLLEKGFNVKIILTPGQDPDEVVRSNTTAYAVDTARPAVPWFLGRMLDKFDYDVYALKEKVIERVTPILTAISDVNQKVLAQDLVSRRLGITGQLNL